MEDQIRLLLKIQAAKLSRNRLGIISYQQLEKYLAATKWSIKRPESISRIARDINDVDVNALTDYLTGSSDEVDQMLDKLKNDLNREID